MIQTQSARHSVAQFTDGIHTRLHHHAVISRLLCDDLTPREYSALLHTYLLIYASAEHRRAALNVWPEFSLHPACTALRSDLNTPYIPNANLFDSIHTPRAALGMLYVLHGAHFGGKVIAKKLHTTLPDTPKSYFEQPSITPLWRSLVATLETSCETTDHQDEIATAAHQTFSVFDETASNLQPTPEGNRPLNTIQA